MLRRRRGRVLAIKWGLNPNSSSLGVDVTFLLVGAAALSVATPFVSALVRLRASKRASSAKTSESSSDEDLAQS
ncbi:MAG: hypothetical protein GY811_29580 [Myxococcales bacterium]|nr:hypothetical protein [Myxococcales bacterium]